MPRPKARDLICWSLGIVLLLCGAVTGDLGAKVALMVTGFVACWWPAMTS